MQERPGECAELLAAGEALTVEACEPVTWPLGKCFGVRCSEQVVSTRLWTHCPLCKYFRAKSGAIPLWRVSGRAFGCVGKNMLQQRFHGQSSQPWRPYVLQLSLQFRNSWDFNRASWFVAEVIFTLEYVLRLSLCHTDARYGSSYLSRTFHYAAARLAYVAIAQGFFGFALSTWADEKDACRHVVIPVPACAEIQPLNVIDVVAVLPFYLKLSLEWSNIGVLSALLASFVSVSCKHHMALFAFAVFAVR